VSVAVRIAGQHSLDALPAGAHRVLGLVPAQPGMALHVVPLDILWAAMMSSFDMLMEPWSLHYAQAAHHPQGCIAVGNGCRAGFRGAAQLAFDHEPRHDGRMLSDMEGQLSVAQLHIGGGHAIESAQMLGP
jgi:hypothetical protein